MDAYQPTITSFCVPCGKKTEYSSEGCIECAMADLVEQGRLKEGTPTEICLKELTDILEQIEDSQKLIQARIASLERLVKERNFLHQKFRKAADRLKSLTQPGTK